MANETFPLPDNHSPSGLLEEPGPAGDRIILWVMTIVLLASALLLDRACKACLWSLPVAVLYLAVSSQPFNTIKPSLKRNAIILASDTVLISVMAYFLQPGPAILAAYTLMLLYQGISHFGYKFCLYQVMLMGISVFTTWLAHPMPVVWDSHPYLKGIAFLFTFGFFLYHGWFYRTRQTRYEEKIATERKQMQRQTWLTTTMANYLSPQIRQLIYHGKDKMQRVETRRRRLTVFFSDIEGFTQLSDELEPEALSAMLNDYLDEMSRIAIRNGGTIDKYIGDSIMVFFGDPTSRGDRANARACLAMAIEMRRHMKVMRKKWRSQGIVQDLNIRMGISTGYCNVGNFGTRDRMDYTLVGRTVNLASRLESLAGSNEILISEETYALVENQIMCRRSKPTLIKGIQHPMSVYQVVDFRKDLGSNPTWIDEELQGFSLYMDTTRLDPIERNKAIRALNQAARQLRERAISSEME
ncbi:adenylate/guanylate cyclase domain-containing protein [Sansalvadorimonas verongulae]|uniref:adenylate/guanylate cyclase domain-containing protein n=1 Tax=Sansalvadorimonas verongulae TaxID=2172824 RepID=UPI0018AD2CF8|nr:adenylate/guanylate cyclase domain-containing protein [Sansalvadorimonas verongulae]